MAAKFHYETVSEAINQLAKRGFTMDFNLEENSVRFEDAGSRSDEFHIVDTFRYEGDTDPADEATVYAIESRRGLKGILVTGYGMYSDDVSSKILEKLT